MNNQGSAERDERRERLERIVLGVGFGRRPRARKAIGLKRNVGEKTMTQMSELSNQLTKIA
ncbi:MAG: hypothetical protein WBE89_00350, partial [Methyloceanibacter sp.]